MPPERVRRSDDQSAKSAIRNPQVRFELSGLEPLNITRDFGFAVIGERTNITGSPKFSKLILAGDFEGAVAVARQQVANGANIIDINIDEGMIDSEATMTRFLNLDRQRTGNRARPGHDRQLEMERDRSGIEMRPGKSRGQFDLAQERRGRIPAPGADRSADMAQP